MLDKKQGQTSWQDSWWKKNAIAIFFLIIFLGGAFIGVVTLIGDVSNNTVVLKEVEIEVDTLVKKHMVLNHSFTSFRLSIEDDIEDMEESLDDLCDEQSETHDLTIKIADRLGVD